MEEEASLLEQVKTKELELKEQEEKARADAESIITDAKKRHSEIVENGRKEGETLAEQKYSQGMEELESEIQVIRSEASKSREETVKRGESRVGDAARRIIEKVAFE
jgi:vacuolar-type H+-ATPase subunit H